MAFASCLHHQHSRPADPACLQILKRAIGLDQRVLRDVHLQASLGGFTEQLAAVFAGVGGDGVDVALAVEIAVVVELGNRGHVDAGKGERAAGGEGEEAVP